MANAKVKNKFNSKVSSTGIFDDELSSDFADNYDEKFHEIFTYDEKLSIPCMPIRLEGKDLLLAAPEEKWEAAKKLANSKNISIKLIPAIEDHILSGIALSKAVSETEDLSNLNTEEASDAPIAAIVQKLIQRAVLERASDLHFEPYEDHLRVRIRVDGRLHDLVRLQIEKAAPILSRIKVLSRLNIIEKLRPQDGQFTVDLPARKVDIRVATSNTIHGEKIVLRIHDINRPSVSLDELGMSSSQLDSFNRMINSSSGLILAAGPTGGGKTTTLHSALRAVTVDYKNVVTIEDPVEYVVEGISQIPVSEARGIGFAIQLRAILRQDPDIILVGETRDAETARISVQAALTGHLVLSSIHATDSVGAIYRLFQMDIEPHLVASSLRGVLSQRLIRRICQYCKIVKPITPRQKGILNSYGLAANELAFGTGCLICSGSGYRDRVAAYQLLEVTEELAELISSRPQPNELRKAAVNMGMTELTKEGLRLAVEQITTINEALTLLDGHED